MAPLDVKSLKPNPAGCEQFVAAMMQGADVLCGPTLFPAIGPVKVSGIALAAPGRASARANAKTPARLSRLISLFMKCPSKVLDLSGTFVLIHCKMLPITEVM